MESAPAGIRTQVEASTGLHDRPLHYRGINFRMCVAGGNHFSFFNFLEERV